MHIVTTLAQSDLGALAKGTKDLAAESLVLATLFFVFVAGFIVLRFGLLPVAKVVLNTVTALATLQAEIKEHKAEMKEHADGLRTAVSELRDHRECKA